MSSVDNLSSSALAALVEDITAQLDGTTGVVKIPFNLYKLLDVKEQIAAKSHASSVLGYPVEFYLDSTDQNRVYLATLAAINVCRPCEARIMPGYSLPVLIPAMPQPAGQLNHASRVNTPQITPSQSSESPPPSPSASRIKRKKATRRSDGFTASRPHQYSSIKQESSGIKKDKAQSSKENGL